MPDGHLPQLHSPQDPRHCQEPDHRRGVDIRRGGRADLRVRPGRRCRTRAVTYQERKEPYMPKQHITLTEEQTEAFGAELDALKERIMADLGERDATYIRRVIKAQRTLEVGGRGLLMAGILPPAWLAGTAMLALSKILDNMEIGHNVMHGQYDWMGDPSISSRGFEWDTACPGDQWRHSHNYMHHTYTNIVGMDRDIGYGILR